MKGPITLAILLVALVLPAGAEAAFPGANGKIAFASNRDGDFEIYTVDPDGSNLTQLTHNTVDDLDPAWSADGKKIAFTSNNDIYAANADGTDPLRLTTTGLLKWSLSWAPDGSKLVFTKRGTCYGTAGCTFQIRTINADGTNNTIFSDNCGADAAWSPDGTTFAARIGYYPDICNGGNLFKINVDHTNSTTICCSGAQPPNWAPDQSRLAFGYGTCTPSPCSTKLATVKPDGSGLMFVQDNVAGNEDPAWSPDGTQIAYTDISPGATSAIRITGWTGIGNVALTDSSSRNIEPDWQPVANPYIRPKGASPLQVFLVPAFAECTSPNNAHGPPRPYSSCSPPSQTSGTLTVGTPDANGQPAKSVAKVFYAARTGDLAITATISDVRNKSDLTDYTGELSLTSGIRITDRNSTPDLDGTGAGTVVDTTLPITIACASTADTTVGSECDLATTVNAVYPGAITAGQRSIWELGQTKAYDGGPDGDAETAGDNTLFMDAGIFIP